MEDPRLETVFGLFDLLSSWPRARTREAWPRFRRGLALIMCHARMCGVWLLQDLMNVWCTPMSCSAHPCLAVETGEVRADATVQESVYSESKGEFGGVSGLDPTALSKALPSARGALSVRRLEEQLCADSDRVANKAHALHLIPRPPGRGV